MWGDYRAAPDSKIVDVGSLKQDGRTSLHFAAAYCREDMVKLLLSKKADPMLPGGVSVPLDVLSHRLGVLSHLLYV